MEFRIAADQLLKALSRTHGIAERKTTIPILANVLIEAAGETVKFSAFDLDIGLTTEHPAEVAQEGAITLSARHLFDLARVVPDATVTFKRAANNAVEIASGKARFKLLGMTADDYPALPKEEKSNLAKIDGASLLAMIERTAFAISTDDTRYTLAGLCFEAPEPGLIRTVATDGYRLAVCQRTMEGADFKLKKSVILPRKGLMELRKLIEEAPDAECFLGFGDTSALFKKSGLTMIMRLIDGQYHDYERVIPREHERQLHLPRLPLVSTLKRIRLLSEEKSHTVRMKLSENSLLISSQNPDLGEATEELAIEYQGPEVNISFNANYLLDVLGVLEDETIRFELVDDESPGVIRPIGPERYIVVVMPMRN